MDYTPLRNSDRKSSYSNNSRSKSQGKRRMGAAFNESTNDFRNT
jgi:hypothetical protein